MPHKTAAATALRLERHERQPAGKLHTGASPLRRSQRQRRERPVIAVVRFVQALRALAVERDAEILADDMADSLCVAPPAAREAAARVPARLRRFARITFRQGEWVPPLEAELAALDVA